ncbi:MAG TPA: hypothetical protein VMV92_22005 [Streptosporangiaceae bacterium]|nr:hypothetical protein [Streptosporangiaceae bacterium]HVB43246.1 hypothetical protein [Streptosporangiaceae bacterium]
MLIVVFLVTAFAGASMVGLIAVVRLSIAREDSDHSLMRRPASRTSAMTRRIVGTHGTFRP